MSDSAGLSTLVSAAWGRRLAALLLGCVAGGAVAPGGAGAAPITELVISEIMFNPPGFNDDGLEWVELFNGTDSVIDLSSYSLGWGGADYTTGTLQLSGTIAPGEYFVIGGPNGGLIYDLIYNFNPNLPNPWFAAAGVALFDVMASEITPTTVPIDAVIYAMPWAPNSNGLIDETGGVGAIDVIVGPFSNDIERQDDESWAAQGDPTPGDGPLNVPEPRPALLVLAGLAALARGRAKFRPGDPAR